MKLFLIHLLFLSCLTVATLAEGPSADQVLAQAEAKAAAEQKTIFVHFGASWCGWCRKLDAFLEKPEVKPVFEKYFVQVKLVVQEDDKHKNLETPGGDAWLQKLGGPAGLPYTAFLDAGGALIANSMQPSAAKKEGENIGYPGSPEEMDWFLKMLRKAAPKISDAELKTLATALQLPKK
jgi:hypothetical protein